MGARKFEKAMKPIDRFSDRVEDYTKYRPSYPPEVVELLKNETGLDENSIVADIGSGTGIFARLLLETGCTVYGVEPNRAMRAAGEKFLQKFERFRSVDGGAEKTNLPGKSVAHITAAQAFHWFDREQTKLEFRRILKPGGWVVLVWNDRQLDATPFLHDYENLLQRFGTDYKEVRHDAIAKTDIKNWFDKDFRQATFSNAQTVDFNGLKGRLLSSSYIPRIGHGRFEEMLSELKNVFDAHSEAGSVQILYQTRVFYGKF